jgi:hypothetical protein
MRRREKFLSALKAFLRGYGSVLDVMGVSHPIYEPRMPVPRSDREAWLMDWAALSMDGQRVKGDFARAADREAEHRDGTSSGRLAAHRHQDTRTSAPPA